MPKDLIIVESPAKVKTIKKFLGPDYMVQASVGHVRDLPSSALGVDEDTFTPQYEVINGKQKVVAELRAAAAKADTVYLAPDPDREGEAIAWHVAELIKDKAHNIKRIQFNEITARAVREALQHPRALNAHLFDAQQARRVLDRLVGYKISPLLWRTIKRGISAGRVQSVALRLIVEREEERRAFKPEEYWLFKATLAGDTPPPFRANLAEVNGKKAAITTREEADALAEAMRGQDFIVQAVEEKERKKAPLPPFITSTLQQAANQRLNYTAKRTMGIAQHLYEGVEIDDLGVTALITYMRTDSFRIADEAQQAAAQFILGQWGREYLPARPPVYKSRGGAQDAHEAIRPVDVNLTPERVKGSLRPDEYNIYRLIWSRFVASQRVAARFHDTTVSITRGVTGWRAKGERLLFPGYLKAMPRSSEEGDNELPKLEVGQHLTIVEEDREQKFTQPPARYTEASLVRELEERGIGRPSTYASIISTLQDRDYVHLEDKHFAPTDLGAVVCEQLCRHFTRLMDVGFTATMEENLDKVAEGERDWVDLLRAFNQDFVPTLAAASTNMRTVKAGMSTDVPCPECGKPLLVKFGKAGAFLACSGYPECRHTSNFVRDEQGKVQPVEREQAPVEKVGVCPKCGSDLVVKQARTGSRFIACTGYPQCKHTAPFSTGVPCPREGCHGTLVEKSSKRGKIFYSCDQFPQCDFAVWDWPVKGECPLCHSPVLVRKKMRDGSSRTACPAKGCRFVLPEGEEPGNATSPLMAPPPLLGKADAPVETAAPRKRAARQGEA